MNSETDPLPQTKMEPEQPAAWRVAADAEADAEAKRRAEAAEAEDRRAADADAKRKHEREFEEWKRTTAAKGGALPTVLVSDTQVATCLSIHRGTVWRLAREDQTFPRPIKLSRGVTRWKLCEIEAWVVARAEASA